ncbi:MAG: (2Fe-2S)-binding protein [Sedimenticola sp.]
MKLKVQKNPLDKLPEILKQDIDRNLCVCNEVLKMDVINAIANGATTLEAVKQQTYATDGNGCCTRQVSRLIECIWDQESAIQTTSDSSKRSK